MAAPPFSGMAGGRKQAGKETFGIGDIWLYFGFLLDVDRRLLAVKEYEMSESEIRKHYEAQSKSVLPSLSHIHVGELLDLLSCVKN